MNELIKYFNEEYSKEYGKVSYPRTTLQIYRVYQAIKSYGINDDKLVELLHNVKLPKPKNTEEWELYVYCLYNMDDSESERKIKDISNKLEILPVKNTHQVIRDGVPVSQQNITLDGNNYKAYIFNDEQITIPDSLVLEDFENKFLAIASHSKGVLNAVISYNDGVNDITKEIELTRDENFTSNYFDYSDYTESSILNITFGFDYGINKFFIYVYYMKQPMKSPIFYEVKKVSLSYSYITNLLDDDYLKSIDYSKINNVPYKLTALVEGSTKTLKTGEYASLFDNLFIWDANKINERLDDTSGVKKNEYYEHNIKVKQKDSEGIGYGQYIPAESMSEYKLFIKAGPDVIVRVYQHKTKQLLNKIKDFPLGEYKEIMVRDGLNRSDGIFIAFTVKDDVTDFYANTYVSDLVLCKSDGFLTKQEVDNKVDKVEGKGLSTVDFTTAYETKLKGLSNYNDTIIKNDIQTINTQLGDIANTGKLTDLNTTEKSSIVGAINEVFQNASNGKTLIAQAITGKGVSTSNTDTFQTMATNINSIQTVSDASGIIFTLNNKKYKLSKNDKGEYIATLLAYSVTSNLTHCTLDNTNTSIDYGNKYTCNISVNKGFIIDSVVITMGGTDVTSTVLKGNIITINSVTGDVIITVNCVEEPANPVYGNIKATPNYTFKINEIKGKLDPDLQVSLATAPNLNQTITITNNTPEYITISPNTLTFTPDNYSVPQKVSISPIRKNNDYLDRRGELVLSSKGVTDYTAKCTIINTDNYIHPSNCTLSDKVLDIHAYGLNSVPTTLESSVNNISCAVTPISNEGDDNVSKATANGLQYVTIDVPSLKPYLNESKGITAIYVSMGYPFVDKNLNSYLNLLGINSTKMNNSSYLFGYTKKPSTKGYEALNSYFYTSFNEKTTSADLHFNVFMFNPSDAPVGITYMIDDTNYTSIGSTGWFDYGKDLTSKISSYKNVSKESNTTFVAYQVYNGILSLDDINTIKNGILENLVPSEVTNTIDNMTVNVGDTILSTATVLPTALEPMCTKSITLKDDKLIKNKNEVIAKAEGQSSFTTTISKPLAGGKTYDYNFDTNVTIAPSYIKDLTVTKAEEGVVISNPISELTVGQEYLLIGTTLPPRFDEENIVYYESSNIEVARVRYGLVEALKEGSCTITAYNHDKTYSYQMPLTIKPKKERIFTNIKTINPSDYSFSATDYEGNYRLMKQIIEEDSAGYDKVVFPKGSVFKLKMPLGTTYNEDGSVNSYQAESSIIPNSNTVYDFNNSRIEMQFSEYLSLDSVYKDGIKVTRGYNLFNFTTKDNPESSIGQYQTVLEDSEIRNLTIVGERQLFPEQYNDSDGGWQIRYVNFATCKRCGIVNCDIGWCTGFNIGSVHGQQSWSPIIQGSHIEWGAINYETGEDDTTTYTDRVRIKKANICQLHKRVINKYTNDNSYSVGIWAGYLGYDYMGARFYDIFFYKHDEATDTYEYLGCHKYEYLYGIYEFPKDATHCRLVFYQKRLPPSGGLNYLGGGIMMITHLPTSVDCYIENCYIHDNYASGFACCGGQRFLVKNCKFERNYGRDGLGCHVDFEDGREGANCCIVSNCTFDDNYYGFIMPSGLYEVLHDNEFNGCGVKTTTESILMFNNIHKNTHFTRQEIGEAIVANSIFSNVTMNEVARSDWEKDYKWKMHMINNHMI
jgi:hypothetical protein